MNNDLISIIVPVYNTATYLQKCIDSLVSQTYPDIEIILVNDGSTDESLKICKENSKRYENIKVFSQNNSGVSAARNRGIRESQGKYITFVDSDDELFLDAIETMYELIVSDELDLVSASMTSDKRIKCVEDKKNTVFCGEKTVALALEEISPSACAKLYRKESIYGIWFEEDKKINEDGFFVFECYMRQLRVIITSRTVYMYRKRSGSASRSEFSEKYLDMLYFMEKKKNWIEQFYPQFTDKMQEIEVRTNLNMLQLLCYNYDKRYDILEKNCCAFIRKKWKINTQSFLRYEKRVYYAVHLRLYPLYKALIRLKQNEKFF